MTGFTRVAQDLLLATGLGPGGVIFVMVAVWFVLGCLIDSISILLLTVPIFFPIAKALGMDLLAFAMIGIVAVETGLLTPPFGLLVFTVKAAIQDPKIGVGSIFTGSIPYWLALLAVILALWYFPQVANYLPNLLKAKA
jgi:C4-dicarboxylate transporter, DctM subunit